MFVLLSGGILPGSIVPNEDSAKFLWSLNVTQKDICRFLTGPSQSLGLVTLVSFAIIADGDSLTFKYFAYIGLAYFLPRLYPPGEEALLRKFLGGLVSFLAGLQWVADGSYTGARSVSAGPLLWLYWQWSASTTDNFGIKSLSFWLIIRHPLYIIAEGGRTPSINVRIIFSFSRGARGRDRLRTPRETEEDQNCALMACQYWYR